VHDGRIVCAVERKTTADLASSMTTGRLGYALGELAALPRAALVVEEPYARIFSHPHVRGATFGDGVAELQVRWPNVPIVFVETRGLAEEWTYRFLAAAYAWAREESAALDLIGMNDDGDAPGPEEPAPSSAELRAWARRNGLDVPARGRIPRAVVDAWEARHD
jgi:hypothetical protein